MGGLAIIKIYLSELLARVKDPASLGNAAAGGRGLARAGCTSYAPSMTFIDNDMDLSDWLIHFVRDRVD
jgi:hypothetical protein